MKKDQGHIEETLLLKILEKRADEEEMILFTNWMEASAENAAYFSQLKKVHQLTSVDTHSRQKNFESIVRKVKSNEEVPDYIELDGQPSTSANFRIHHLIRAAAILIVLLGVSLLIKNFVFNSEQLIISGNDLEKNEPFQLADGSLVFLNGNSEISFSKKFGERSRDLTLKGEAFFKVQKNEEIPFRVLTSKTTIQVLGTSFNVLSDPSERVSVYVVSGVVEFFTDRRKDLTELKAGDQGTFDHEQNSIEKEQIHDNNFLAWKTGILYFNEAPLPEVLELLQKQYSQIMIFEEKQHELPTLTTKIDNLSLDAVLKELSLLLNINYKIKNDTIYFKTNS